MARHGFKPPTFTPDEWTRIAGALEATQPTLAIQIYEALGLIRTADSIRAEFERLRG